MTSAIDKALRYRKARSTAEGEPEVVDSVLISGDLASDLADSGQGGKFETTIEGGGKGAWIPLWEVTSGVETNVKESNLFWVMELTDTKGDYLFTPDKSEAVKYIPGTLLCPLHPEHEKRELAIAAGVGGIVCPKSNLRSGFDQRRHGEKSHSDEMKTIKEYEDKLRSDRAEVREERDSEIADLQRKLFLQQLASAPEAPVVHPEQPVHTETNTPTTTTSTVGFQCSDCRKAPFKTERGLKLHQSKMSGRGKHG